MSTNFQLLTKPTSSTPSSSSHPHSHIRHHRPLYKTLSLSYQLPSSPSRRFPPQTFPTTTSQNPHTSETFQKSTPSLLITLARRLAFEFALFMLGGGFNLMLVLLWPGWIPILSVVAGCWWVWGWGKRWGMRDENRGKCEGMWMDGRWGRARCIREVKGMDG